ncbi:putative sugar O-methyltransferase [Sulfurimonas sp.]|jgi:putative sugar O-methyltransferase|uniref:putative sugar O-methyltransferase n=1 Tax=Sulfurimonas sp. TaxID=2022749 RepID=UPI0025FCA783|nr:putative sugar O-methyltransferase [Sulfurimonas sp.]MBT5935834.1 putative sugar O-methyltransferase [Sulfurimonas sp.]
MQQTQQLQELLKEMSKQSSLYKPTTFWQEASKIISDELNAKDIKYFRAFDSSLSMFAPTYAFPYYLKNKSKFEPVQNLLEKTTDDIKSKIKLTNTITGKVQAFADYRVLNAGNIDSPPYTDKVSESNIGTPLEQFEFDGRKFSRSFLNYLLGLSFLKKHLDTEEIKTVFEIGGGYGTLGEILLGDSRNDCFYINADIPPVVHVSSYYLKEIFGESNIATFEELKDLDTIDIQSLKVNYKALNIPSWFTPKLQGSIDLFVNFISFQEMEPEVVKNYCKHVDRLSPKYILLRNIKEGKRKQDKDFLYGVKDPIKGINYDEYLSNYRLVTTDEAIFGLKMEDDFHSQLRLYKKINT